MLGASPDGDNQGSEFVVAVGVVVRDDKPAGRDKPVGRPGVGATIAVIREDSLLNV